MRLTLILIIGTILFSLVSAASPQEVNLPSQYNCTAETNPLEIKIIELNKTLNDNLSNLTYYINLSEYYQDLYESKEINITNRELIQIFNAFEIYQLSLNQTNNTLNDIKNKFSIFTFEVGISILSVAGISVVLIELGFYLKRRKENESNI